MSDLIEKLDASTWITIAVVVISTAANFGALSWRIGAVEDRVAELDKRLYQLTLERSRGAHAPAVPPDVTFVALTSLEE